jgi:predicted Zn-dependent protease
MHVRSIHRLFASLFLVSSTVVLGAAGLGAATGERYEYSRLEVAAASARELADLVRSRPASAAYGEAGDIFRRIIESAQRLWPEAAALELALVDDRWPLALSSASGQIVLSTGFFSRYQPGPDELAFVLGHEVAHLVLEHQRAQLSAVWRRNAPQRLKAEYAMEFLQTEPLVRAQIARMASSHEREADRVGLLIAAHAGFDAMQALRYFDTVRAVDERSGIYETPHDSPEGRQAALRRLAQRLSRDTAFLAWR